MSNSGRNWAVRLVTGVYVAGWGTRVHQKRAGVHFVDSAGSWVRVSDTPRLMTKRNAIRGAFAVKRVGVAGVCVVGGAA